MNETTSTIGVHSMAKGQKHDQVYHQKSRLGAVLSDNLPIWDGNEEY